LAQADTRTTNLRLKPKAIHKKTPEEIHKQMVPEAIHEEAQANHGAFHKQRTHAITVLSCSTPTQNYFRNPSRKPKETSIGSLVKLIT